MSNEDQIKEIKKAFLKQINKLNEIEEEYFAYRDAGGDEQMDFVEGEYQAYRSYRDAGNDKQIDEGKKSYRAYFAYRDADRNTKLDKL